MFDHKKVIEFWTWFKTIAQDLSQKPTDGILIQQIDSFVKNLGPYDWELGPYNSTNFYFAISPNLSFKLLEETKQIIELAPTCEGWSFLSAKPPKEWKGIWKMKNEFGKEIQIEANNWKYILYEFDDQTFAIDLIISPINGNEDTVMLAADIALTGFLGEENYMQLIQDVKVLLDFEVTGTGTAVPYIRDHIRSLGYKI